MAYKDKSKAAKMQNKWIAATYDRINLTVPKGEKETIQEHAALHDGGSVNAFINRAIRETMERDKEKTYAAYLRVAKKKQIDT